PTLADLNTAGNRVGFLPVRDDSSPNGVTSALFELGNSRDISVERASSWTTGFDIDTTRWIPGLSLSATYFNINFHDRIQLPTFPPNVLNTPTLPYSLPRNPSPAELTAACSRGPSAGAGACVASGATAIIDVRNRNLASVHTSGIDLNT